MRRCLLLATHRIGHCASLVLALHVASIARGYAASKTANRQSVSRLVWYDVRQRTFRPVTTNLDRPNLRHVPCGATLLTDVAGRPATNANNEAVIAIKQIALNAKKKLVLVVETATGVTVNGLRARPDKTRRGRQRTRVPMRTDGRGRFFVDLRVPLTRGQDPAAAAADLRYSVRVDDRPGPFDNTYARSIYRHGLLDHAALAAEGPEGTTAVVRGVIPPAATRRYFAPRTNRQPGQEIVYELHTGTFTQEGTFAAAAERLNHVADMATLIQVMPPSLASGPRSWGYDVVRVAAIDATLGGWRGLQTLSRVAHQKNLGVLLDLQPTHQGPYADTRTRFTDVFSGHDCWGGKSIVRPTQRKAYNAFLEQIVTELDTMVHLGGVDGFRLDHTREVAPQTKDAIIAGMVETAKRVDKRLTLVFEDICANARMGSKWDNHPHVNVMQYSAEPEFRLRLALNRHAQQNLFPSPPHAAKLKSPFWRTMMAMQRGFIPRRGRGDPTTRPLSHFLTALLMDHDGIANVRLGKRMSEIVSFAQYKALLALLYLGPWTPNMFMGTERYAKEPWMFFHSHPSADLARRTRQRRYYDYYHAYEAAGFRPPDAFKDPVTGKIDDHAYRTQVNADGVAFPDPAAAAAFEQSKLHWDPLDAEQRAVLKLARKLARRRKTDLRAFDIQHQNTQIKAWDKDGDKPAVMVMRRRAAGKELVMLWNMGANAETVSWSAKAVEINSRDQGRVIPLRNGTAEREWQFNGRYRCILNTDATEFAGIPTTGRLQPMTINADNKAKAVHLPPETMLVYAN